MAIGEPELVDTSKDPRLSRIFANKVLKIYPAFRDFYGMEDTIEQIVAFIRHAAQGLEEKKTNSVPARAAGRRQIFSRGKAEVADGEDSVLFDQRFARQRIAAQPVLARRRRPYS